MSTDKLFEQLEAVKAESSLKADEIKSLILVELTAQWDDWQELQTALDKLENHTDVDYIGQEDGIYATIRFYSVKDIPEQEHEFFETYIASRGMTADIFNDCLMIWQGDDHYQIQDDTRHDNGVWQGHKVVIKETEYRAKFLNEDLEPEEALDEDDDDTRRNLLIEAHMEKTGYFPGVFRVDRSGNVFPVNTIAPKDKV